MVKEMIIRLLSRPNGATGSQRRIANANHFGKPNWRGTQKAMGCPTSSRWRGCSALPWLRKRLTPALGDNIGFSSVFHLLLLVFMVSIGGLLFAFFIVRF
jgi:hypothetical protein